MNPIIEIALRNLIQAKRRGLLLGSAIAVVTALMLILTSFSAGISSRMIQSATTLSSGHVTVGGFFKGRSNGAAPLITDYQKVKDLVKKNVPESRLVIDRVRSWGRVIGPSASINTGVSGIRYEDEQDFFASLVLAKENSYSKNGTDQRKGDFSLFKNENSVILFAAQAKRMDIQVGDIVTFVTEVNNQQSNTADLTVVAICEDFGFLSNFSIFVPRATAIKLNNVKDSVTGAIYVYLKDISKSELVLQRLNKVFEDEGYKMMDHDPNPFFMKFPKVQTADWLGQKLDLTTWNEEISFLSWVTIALNALSFFLLALLAFIIATGIANSLSMAVRERTREIGTIRAIGMFRSSVAYLFLAEAFFLGLLATATGSVIGFVCVKLLNLSNIKLPDALSSFLMSHYLYFKLEITDVFWAMLIFTGITALAALPPALRAAKLQPVEAMRRSS